jgi:hypothetical protein
MANERQSFHLTLKPEVRSALGRSATRNHRSMTGEILVAIEDHLRRAGLLVDESEPVKGAA